MANLSQTEQTHGCLATGDRRRSAVSDGHSGDGRRASYMSVRNTHDKTRTPRPDSAYYSSISAALKHANRTCNAPEIATLDQIGRMVTRVGTMWRGVRGVGLAVTLEAAGRSRCRRPAGVIVVDQYGNGEGDRRRVYGRGCSRLGFRSRLASAVRADKAEGGRGERSGEPAMAGRSRIAVGWRVAVGVERGYRSMSSSS